MGAPKVQSDCHVAAVSFHDCLVQSPGGLNVGEVDVQKVFYL
jgi:hypothetical protein